MNAKLRLVIPVIIMTIVLAVAGHAAGEPLSPPLNSYDIERAALFDVSRVEAGSADFGSTSMTVERAISVADAEIGLGARVPFVYRGEAARFVDEPLRPVFVVTVHGGVVPNTGPVGEAREPRTVRITGIIVDAESGEFMRGFMHNGELPALRSRRS